VHKRLRNLPDPQAQEIATMGRNICLAFLAIMAVGLTGSVAYLWPPFMFMALTVCLKQMASRYEAST